MPGVLVSVDVTSYQLLLVDDASTSNGPGRAGVVLHVTQPMRNLGRPKDGGGRRGCLLLLNLTGHPPFGGETAEALLYQHLNTPVPLEPVPEALRPLVTAGTAKEPGPGPGHQARYHPLSGRRQMSRSCISSICLSMTSRRYSSWLYGARSR
jgi:hypothetical protein